MSTKNQDKSFVQWVKDNHTMVYMIVALLALRWTFVEPYVVPTGSMEPTLKTGDRLYALKCAYDVRIPFTEKILFKTGDVKRGDIILFRYPENPDITFVKRAVGIPGDRVEIREGKLIINGQELERKELTDRSLMYDIEEADDKSLYVENLTGLKHYMILTHSHEYNVKSRFMEEIVVPEGKLLAIGDNRDNSHDSRWWGFVPMENLKGKAMFIWYSSWDPELKASMVADYSLPMRVLAFFYEFFKFFPDWAQGKAWVRYERIGTFTQ